MSALRTLLCAALLCLGFGLQALADGWVSGQARDEEGRPLPGIAVEVVYLTYGADRISGYGESYKIETVTGEDGRYSVSLRGLPPGEYAAHAYRILRNGGRDLVIDLIPDDPASFASTEQVVRDFTQRFIESSEELPYGNGGIFVLNPDIAEAADLSAAEIRLENLESGRVIVKPLRRTGEGLVVTGIPFGRYRAAAMLEGAPLLLALQGSDAPFALSVEHDFTMGYLGDQFIVLARRPPG